MSQIFKQDVVAPQSESIMYLKHDGYCRNPKSPRLLIQAQLLVLMLSLNAIDVKVPRQVLERVTAQATIRQG